MKAATCRVNKERCSKLKATGQWNNKTR